MKTNPGVKWLQKMWERCGENWRRGQQHNSVQCRMHLYSVQCISLLFTNRPALLAHTDTNTYMSIYAHWIGAFLSVCIFAFVQLSCEQLVRISEVRRRLNCGVSRLKNSPRICILRSFIHLHWLIILITVSVVVVIVWIIVVIAITIIPKLPKNIW